MAARHQYEMIPFTAGDVELLTPVMKRAFDADSQFHRGCDGGPPGYDDGSFLRQWALHPHATAFRLNVDGRPGGAAIIWLNAYPGVNILGCIFLDPDFQHSGLGLEIWQELERRYPASREWRVETPGLARMNHHFYVNKCGFEIYRIENPKSPEEASYQMRKRYGGGNAPVIENREAFQVLAMTRQFSAENCTAAIPEFWTWFRENGYQKIICGMFGICHQPSADGKSFSYSIASPYDGKSPVSDGFEVLTIPAHTWAVFKCVGAMPHAIQNMWGRVESGLLQGFGYERIYGFDIEQYTPGDLQSRSYESYIWVPVKKKAGN